MALDRLPYCLLMLEVLAIVGVAHQVHVDQDLRSFDVVFLELLDIDFRSLTCGIIQVLISMLFIVGSHLGLCLLRL